MPKKNKDEETNKTEENKEIETEVEETLEQASEESVEEKVEEIEERDSEIKEEIPEEITSKKETLLAPLETYIKVSIHIGTRAVTPTMREYVYRRKADGIAVLNTKKVDEKIAQGAGFLANYAPEDIIVCGKKDAATKPLEAFAKATGIRIFTRYPAGIITNPVLKNFFEPKLVFVLDPWVDKNALNDAVKIKVPVMALCSTNNNTHNIDFVIPCNNKTTNSVGLVLYLLAKLYTEKRKLDKQVVESDFYSLEEKREERVREKIDMTEARALIRKKLEEMKAKAQNKEIEEKNLDEVKKEVLNEKKEKKPKKEKKEKKEKVKKEKKE
jgi:small subunit ribosomal protein S2